MRQDAEMNDELEADSDGTNTINIHVYTDDGRLLSEYTLNSKRDKVSTLGTAEDSARQKLTKCFFEPLILIVSEQTLSAFMRRTQRAQSSSRPPSTHTTIP